MISATTPTESLTFAYDVDGIRWRKTVSGVATHFVVDKNRDFAQVLEERDAAGALQRLYVYGDDLISQQGPEGDRFYHVDGQMSTRQLTDSSATVTDTYTFDGFGITLAQTGATPNSILYAGEQLDPNVGLYYLRARYLNRTVGRFTSQDTFHGVPGEPATLHKYLYGGHDPLNHRDPSGLFTLIEVLIVVLIIGILLAIALPVLFRFLKNARVAEKQLNINSALKSGAAQPRNAVVLNALKPLLEPRTELVRVNGNTELVDTLGTGGSITQSPTGTLSLDISGDNPVISDQHQNPFAIAFLIFFLGIRRIQGSPNTLQSLADALYVTSLNIYGPNMSHMDPAQGGLTAADQAVFNSAKSIYDAGHTPGAYAAFISALALLYPSYTNLDNPGEPPYSPFDGNSWNQLLQGTGPQ